MMIATGQSGEIPGDRQIPGWEWCNPPSAQDDLFLRGSRYLQAVRSVAVRSNWIELPGNSLERLQACTWIGATIHQVNQHLFELLHTCLACFPPASQRDIQILAAPLAPYTGLDGFCNDVTRPLTIVVDPSRTLPADWLNLVVHEVAHGIAPVPGHGPEFETILTQLCIALDLPLPSQSDGTTADLNAWPPYRLHPQGDQFWLGTTDPKIWGAAMPGIKPG